MTIIDFLAFISNPDSILRTQAVGVLGMVEDTRALAPIQAAYPRETDDNVRQVMDWTGKRLAAAHQRGYDIYQDILERFGVRAEIDAFVQADMSDQEAELLRRVASQTGQDGISMKAGSTLGRAFIGYQMGGFAGAAMMAMSDIVNSRIHSDGIDPTRGLSRRAVPQVPTERDFRPALTILTTERDPKAREKSIVEIGQINNMSVLPHLVRSFVRDPDPTVRETVERIAKGIYLGAIYAKLSAEGVIEREVQDQIAAFRKGMKEMAQQEASKGNQEASPDEIKAMLAKAQAKREEQRRKKR